MIPALLEGVGSLALPCSLTVVVPGIAVALASRRSPIAAATGYLVALVAVAWLRVAGYLAATPAGWTAVAIGAAILIGFVGFTRVSVPGRSVTAAALGALPGLGAAWIWQPCVGPELGSILNRASAGEIAALPLLGAFLLGAGLVVLAVALVRVVIADTDHPARIVTGVGVVTGVAVAVAVSSGIYRDVVGWLARVSQ